nr:GAM-1 [Tawny frogmouth aviadenovirus A]
MAPTLECGNPCEVGLVWFTTIVPTDAASNEQYYQMKLETAVRSTPIIMNTPLYAAWALCRFRVHIVKAKIQPIKNKSYTLLNCTIRFHSLLLLPPDKKRELLRYVAHRLFCTRDSVRNINASFLTEYPHLILRPEGFPLQTSVALRLAVRSLCMAVSEKITHCPKESTVKQLKITAPTKDAPAMQPVYCRTSLENKIPPAYQPIALQGICYTPAVKVDSDGAGHETWNLHLHTPDTSRPPAENPNGPRQPLPLEQQARMALLQSHFIAKRRSLINGRYTPYPKQTSNKRT